MSLLALIATTAASPGGPDPTDLLGPYPTARPFNPPTPCTIPTYDGSDETIHPGAWDFGRGQKWHGFRFWLANTPYPDNTEPLENPCIWASDDGHTWVVPPGLTNPIYDYPSPAGTHWSDTDLYYDHTTDQLALVYRDGAANNYIATSPDGITWDTYPGTFIFQAGVSPSIVRTPEGTWRVYYSNSTLFYRESTGAVTGPYGPEVACDGGNGWHSHVLYDEKLGMYLAAANNGVFPYWSTDGIIWNGRSALISGQTYRPCLRRYDADTFSLWYSTGTTGGANLTWYTRFAETAFFS